MARLGIANVALAALFSALLAHAVPARAEPAPGTIPALDLSGPDEGARSFVDAWRGGDFFVVYMTLDPVLRERFALMIDRFDFEGLLGDVPPGEFFDEMELRMAESMPEHVAGQIPVDRFAAFAGLMGTARALDLPLLELRAVSGSAAPAEIEDDTASVRLGADRTLVLRRSAEGRWRVLGLQGEDLPDFWKTAE